MPDEITNELQPSWAKFLLSSIASSFNTTFHYSGNSIRNKIIVNNILNFGSQSTKDDSAVIEEKKTLYTEVIPRNQIILKLIWTYLRIEDKINCTMVCKGFNNIISDMNCFRLCVDLSTKFRVIPRLSRNYETVIFKNYECNILKEPMKKMLKQLNRRVEKTIFDDCKFDMMALNGFLSELTMLKSLELNMLLTIDDNIEIDFDDLPQLFQLKDLTINVNGDKMEEILEMFSSASNIQSLCLSLFDATIKHKVLDYMKRYKRILKSLRFTKCIVDKAENLVNLNSLHLYSTKKLPSKDYRSFDDLQNLRVLHLSEVDFDLLDILDTKCISFLNELKIVYSIHQNDKVNIFFCNYMCRIGINQIEQRVLKNSSTIVGQNQRPVMHYKEQTFVFKKPKDSTSLNANDFLQRSDNYSRYSGFYYDPSDCDDGIPMNSISAIEQFNKSEHRKKCLTDFSDKNTYFANTLGFETKKCLGNISIIIF